jgi:thiamine biosynthesis lipoprotein
MDVYSAKKPLFGKEVEFVLFEMDELLAEPVIDIAYKEGLRLQKIFNFYNEASELSILNKKRKLNVSDELLQLISKALEFSKLNLDYDITKGRLFKSRKAGLPETKTNCSYKDVVISKNTITLMHDDVLIDLGSIAKGFIVDKMAEILIDEGVESGIVDGRGDVKVFGQQQIVGVQHPRIKDSLLCSISLCNQAAATSGDYSQYKGSFDNSHIVAAKNLVSVTVVADDLATADLFATVLFVSDTGLINSLLNKHKNIKVLTVDKDLKKTYFNGFEELIHDKA